MAVIDLRDRGGQDLGQSLLQFFMQRERLELQKEAQAQREKEFKFAQEQAQAQAQGAQASLGALLTQNPQASQILAQSFPQAASPAQSFTPNLTPGQAQPVPQTVDPSKVPGPAAEAFVEGAGPIFERLGAQEDVEEALGIIRKEADRLGDRSIAQRAEAAIRLNLAGVDASVVTQSLPPSARELVDLESAKLSLAQLEDERDADTFATAWLQRQGVVPEGAPLIPGAGETLLNVVESREGKAIDWTQEGLDFITSRVGDAASGSSFPFSVDPNTGQLTPTSGEAIDVDQAVSEWRALVSSFAPEEKREEILEKVDSGLFQRRLRVSQATNLASDILSGSEDRTQAVADVREILAEDFTESEITSILKKARQRASRPSR